jgi:hypothetical protein
MIELTFVNASLSQPHWLEYSGRVGRAFLFLSKALQFGFPDNSSFVCIAKLMFSIVGDQMDMQMVRLSIFRIFVRRELDWGKAAHDPKLVRSSHGKVGPHIGYGFGRVGKVIIEMVTFHFFDDAIKGLSALFNHVIKARRLSRCQLWQRQGLVHVFGDLSNEFRLLLQC